MKIVIAFGFGAADARAASWNEGKARQTQEMAEHFLRPHGTPPIRPPAISIAIGLDGQLVFAGSNAVGAAIIGGVLLCANPAVAGTGVPVPVRKPGLWEITSISAAHGMHSSETCIGIGNSIAATTSPGDCGAPEVHAASDQIIVNVVCTSPKGREKTSTLFTGNFTTWYRGIV